MALIRIHKISKPPDITSLNEEISRIQEIVNTPGKRKLPETSSCDRLVVRPRNAATLVIVDHMAGSARILMGQRHRSLKFMPGAMVFPGGSVDRTDGSIVAAAQMPAATQAKIINNLRGRPTRRAAHALGMAAIREAGEETGILIGQAGSSKIKRKDWQAFDNNGIVPSLTGFSLLARAITPPGLPRRFDTWFFIVNAQAIGHVPENGFDPSGELESLQWIRPQDALSGSTREITRVILLELMQRLKVDPKLDPEFPAPFYHAVRKRFHKSQL
jgi:8-oxo-dGTP pyrophosphatase MutT (NUDIX family)